MTTAKVEVKQPKTCHSPRAKRPRRSVILGGAVDAIQSRIQDPLAVTAENARRVALTLHNARDPLAMLALSVALDVRQAVTDAHDAAEMIAQSMGAAEWAEVAPMIGGAA